MSGRDVLSLLQVGFSGFAAVMAILAFRLIRQFLGNPTDASIKTKASLLRDFARYTLYLSMIVIVGISIEHGFDYFSKGLAANALLSSKAAQDCREAVDGLDGPETAARSDHEIRTNIKLVQTSCRSVLQDIESHR